MFVPGPLGLSAPGAAATSVTTPARPEGDSAAPTQGRVVTLPVDGVVAHPGHQETPEPAEFPVNRRQSTRFKQQVVEE